MKIKALLFFQQCNLNQMRKIKLIIAFFLCFGALYGQDLQFADKIIKTLTSKEFYGRGYVNNGTGRAAEFIESQLTSLGIPLLDQPEFGVPVNTFPGKMLLRINGKKLVPGKDYLVDPASPSLQLTTHSFEVIDSSWLVNEEILRRQLKKSNSDLVLVDIRSLNFKDIQERLNYLKYSQEPGHKALIIVDDNKLTWGLSQVQSVRPVIYIKSEVELVPLEKVVISFDAVYYENYPVQNVAGMVEGLQSDSLIVITAHYDHLGMMGAKTIFPGANDNASGVAMLLNLAQHFSKSPANKSLLFVAFAAEELGLLGSLYFVNQPPVDLSKIKFMVNFDLAGTGSEGVTIVNATKYPERFQELTALNDSLDLLPVIKKRGEACISDHCPFDRMGIPCFYIYTMGGIQAYHDIYDRYETLPLTEFEDYRELIIHFIESL